jgi:hypothetical protein
MRTPRIARRGTADGRKEPPQAPGASNEARPAEQLLCALYRSLAVSGTDPGPQLSTHGIHYVLS